MAVQVPVLNRFQPQADQSVGRIQSTAPDVVGAIAPQVKAADNLIDKTLDYANKVELHDADVAAQSKANEYERKYKTKLEEIRKSEGDPTELYKALDTESAKWTSDYKAAGGSERLVNAVADKINRTNQRLFESRSTSQAAQYSVYEKKVNEATLSLQKGDAIDTLGNLNLSDKTSVATFDARVDSIRQIVQKRGAAQGLVGEDGRHSPILDEKIREQVSDLVGTSIQTLNAAGKTDEAEYLLNKYSGELSPKEKLKLTKGKDESVVNKEALKLLDVVNSLPPEQAQAYMDRKSIAPEVREKLQDKYHTSQLRKKQNSDALGKDLYEKVNDTITNGNFVNYKEFLANDAVKGLNIVDRLTQKQLSALQARFDAPKASDPEVEGKLYEYLNKGVLKDASFGDLTMSLQGLSKPDQIKWKGIWNNEVHQTDPAKSAMVKSMGSQLPKIMEEAGLVKKIEDRFYSLKDRNLITKLNTQIVLSSEHQKLNPAEQTKWLQKAVADEVAKRPFEPPVREKFQFQKPTKPDTASVTKVPGVVTSPITQATRKQVYADFKKAKGRWPTTPTDMAEIAKTLKESK